MTPQPSSRQTPRVGFFGRINQILSFTRIIVSNLLFLLIIVFVISLFFGSDEGAVEVPDGSALTLRLDAPIVEQAPRPEITELLFEGQNASQPIQLRDLLKVLDRAADDARINTLVVDLDRFPGAAPATLKALGDALVDFREASGKPIVVHAEHLEQAGYYIASHADELYLDPMGQVRLTGLALQPTYFGSALDHLRVNIHVFRSGEFKSAIEPFIQDGMSEPARSNAQQLVDQVWSSLQARMARNRGLDADTLDALIEDQPQRLQELKGDTATMALESGLIDELLTWDMNNERLAERVGTNKEDGRFRHTDHRDYLAQISAETPTEGAAIGLVIAEGTILGGEQPAGVAIGESLLRKLREVRRDDNMAALVLRVNSPGGSALFSELIRRELELIQLAGKPVVVSMGATAASGGYWISATADQILAQPETITGSIGVYSLLPTMEDSAAQLGIHVDGVRTHPLAGAGNPLTALDDDLATMFEAQVAQIDRRFRELVVRGRGLEPDAVADLAEGRIWSGQAALELGLVDSLGNLDQAIATAAELANLERWHLDEMEEPMTARDLLFQWLLQSGAGALASQWLASGPDVAWWQVLRPASQQLLPMIQLLEQSPRPLALCSHCRLSR